MAEQEPVDSESPIDPTTQRTARAYLDARIRELEGRNAALEASRDLHRDRADTYRARVELAHVRMATMSRVARMWLLLRMSWRRPRKLVRLPLELFRVARSGPSTPTLSLGDVVRSEEELEQAAAETHRSETLREVGERFRSGGATRRTTSLRIALIADDPMRASLEAECEVVALTPDRWREQLTAGEVDLLLVESAQRGNGRSWQHRIGWEAHPLAIGLDDLRSLLGGCHELGVPTVFWDTRGRPHWARHEAAALLFDQFFSVDPSVVQRATEIPTRRYQRADFLRPAAQPRLHHPIRGIDRTVNDGPEAGFDDRPAYLGGIDPRLPLAQREALEALLLAAAPFGLLILDPDAGSAPKGSTLPPGLRDHLSGRLREARVPSALRRHPLFLAGGHGRGTGIVPDRLPSLLAAGRAVVATQGGGVGELLGGLVREVEGGEEAAVAIGELLGSDGERRRLRVASVPRVAEAHTIRHRVATIARSVGLAVDGGPEPLGVLVLHDDEERATTAQLVESIQGQRRTPAEIVVGSRDPDGIGRDLSALLRDRLPGIPVRLVAQDDARAGERIRRLAGVASSGLLAILDGRHHYGPDHLAELAAIAEGPPFDVVGICRHLTLDGRVVEGAEDAVVEAVHPHAALARRDVILEGGWPDDPSTALPFFSDRTEAGIRIVATSGDGFVADPRLVMRIPEGAAA